MYGRGLAESIEDSVPGKREGLAFTIAAMEEIQSPNTQLPLQSITFF